MEDYIILIPFNTMYEPEQFVHQHNGIERYTCMFFPNRGKSNPEKFILVIEKWNFFKEQNKIPDNFLRYCHEGFICENKKVLNCLKNDIKNSKKYTKPYIEWKLTDGRYIYIPTNINKPSVIFTGIIT